MPHLEPTNLPYIYDGLIKSSIYPENSDIFTILFIIRIINHCGLNWVVTIEHYSNLNSRQKQNLTL